jgi:DinB family protein
MRASDGLTALAHCRTVLARVTAGMTVDDLDHRHFPDAKSNGEVLLHIAGFEFLVIASAQLARGEKPNVSLWPTLKPGFAREAGFAPPHRRGLDDYFQALDAVRERTV